MSEEIKQIEEYYQNQEGNTTKITLFEKYNYKEKRTYKFNLYSCNQLLLLLFEKTNIVKNKEITTKINETDLLLLQWFIDFKNTDKMKSYINKEGDNLEYFWVKYEEILLQFPLLEGRLTKQSVYLHFKKLADFNILQRVTVTNRYGVYSYYRLNTEIYDLLYYENNDTPEKIINNMRRVYNILLTPQYNFINPPNKILLNKLLFYKINYYNSENITIINNSNIKDTEYPNKEKKEYNIPNKKELKKQTYKLTEKDYIYIPIIELWNNLKIENKNYKLTKHTIPENYKNKKEIEVNKTIKNIISNLKELTNGNFFKNKTFDDFNKKEIKAINEYLSKENQNYKFTLEDIIEVIKEYPNAFKEGSSIYLNGNNHKIEYLPKSLNDFLFFQRNNKSTFITIFANGVKDSNKKIKQQEINDNNIDDSFIKVLQKYDFPISESNKDRYKLKISKWIDKIDNWIKNTGDLFYLTTTTPNLLGKYEFYFKSGNYNKFRLFDEFLDYNYKDMEDLHIGFLNTEGKIWENFVDFVEEHIKISIYENENWTIDEKYRYRYDYCSMNHFETKGWLGFYRYCEIEDKSYGNLKRLFKKFDFRNYYIKSIIPKLTEEFGFTKEVTDKLWNEYKDFEPDLFHQLNDNEGAGDIKDFYLYVYAGWITREECYYIQNNFERKEWKNELQKLADKSDKKRGVA